MRQRWKKGRYKGVHVVTTGIGTQCISYVSNSSLCYNVILMKKMDLSSNMRYDPCLERDSALSASNFLRLPKMKSAIRMFALLVAIAGLASASFAPATTQPMPRHASASASGPGPLDLPGPLPCESDGTCPPLTASIR